MDGTKNAAPVNPSELKDSAARVNHATIAAVHRAADEGRDAGLCLLPPSEDGNKRPLPNKNGIWAPYQDRIPTEDEHRRWYPGRSGIGMVAGEVSRRHWPAPRNDTRH